MIDEMLEEACAAYWAAHTAQDKADLARAKGRSVRMGYSTWAQLEAGSKKERIRELMRPVVKVIRAMAAHEYVEERKCLAQNILDEREACAMTAVLSAGLLVRGTQRETALTIAAKIRARKS